MIFLAVFMLILLYGFIGGIIATIVCVISDHHEPNDFAFFILILMWPLQLLMLLFLLAAFVVKTISAHPITWILWLIFIIWFSIRIVPSHAACVPTELEQGWKEQTIVQGEQPIALIELASINIITPTPPSPEDLELMANVIFYENRDSEYAMWLTGLVVLNRVHDPDFPNTVREVLYQKHPIQYSTTKYFFTKEIPEEIYILARKIFRDDGSIPRNVVYQAQFKQGSGVYDHPGDYFCYK